MNGLEADTSAWIDSLEGDLFPSLHPGLVLGQDISHYCPSLMYGELSLETLALALRLCENMGLPRDNASLCDVGCGIGRCVYRAALLRRWTRCHGIEIYAPRFKLAMEALARWKEHISAADEEGLWARARGVAGTTDVGFTEGDVLEQDSLAGYDVLLFVSAAFTDALLAQMAEAVDGLPPGVMAICITKSLPSAKWVEVHREEREEPWGRAVLIIQQKRE